MATRIYTDATDFDAQQGHFTIEGVDNQYYLRIGALNSEDRRLIASLIEDGFVGFFQDEVRIAIAGIASTYDATNDRIEIDRDPELQIEDEYVIRFTQARPGEDGEGGIGTPGEDGEHAEIEVEDTDTGIRVRGKSGGEPDFGSWFHVRDGMDGEPGQEGEDGRHAEIEVEDTPSDNENAPGIRVRGKSGGETDFGEWHYVQDGKDGQDGVGSDGNPLVTRGELIATSGYIPQTANGNMARTVAWTLNSKSGYVDTTPATESSTGNEDKFTVLASPDIGILNVPYKPVTDQVLGLWAVTEDLSHAEGDREIRPTFIPWGVGGLEDDDNPNYFISRHVIHFGREPASSTVGADVVILYFTVRNKDYKAQIIIRAYGDSLPSTQCRVKIYLAGAFGSVYEKAGDEGWSPKFATVSDGARRVLQVADWFGGGGTKPDVGQYVGETGFVAAIADGIDIRGAAGQDGEDSTVPGPPGPPGRDGVSGGGDCVEQVILDDPTGAQNATTVALPENYTDFKDVYVAIMENNEIRSNTIKIEALVNGRAYRVGASSDVVWTEATRTLTDTGGHANSNFRYVVLTGCEDRETPTDGDDGWTPELATITRGNEEVHQVVDYFGGEGDKPETGQYVGETGLVDDIADAKNIKGSDGQDGQDGIGNVQMTTNQFTPELRSIHYHNLNGQWRKRNIVNNNNNYISITGETGTYYKWGNHVLFYACFDVDIGSQLNDKVRHARLFISPPHGRFSGERLGDAHGMGTPFSRHAGWFAVNVTVGDHGSGVDSNGNLTNETIKNSVQVDCIAVDQTDGSGFAAISISGVYTIFDNR